MKKGRENFPRGAGGRPDANDVKQLREPVQQQQPRQKNIWRKPHQTYPPIMNLPLPLEPRVVGKHCRVARPRTWRHAPTVRPIVWAGGHVGVRHGLHSKDAAAVDTNCPVFVNFGEYAFGFELRGFARGVAAEGEGEKEFDW